MYSSLEYYLISRHYDLYLVAQLPRHLLRHGRVSSALTSWVFTGGGAVTGCFYICVRRYTDSTQLGHCWANFSFIMILVVGLIDMRSKAKWHTFLLEMAMTFYPLSYLIYMVMVYKKYFSVVSVNPLSAGDVFKRIHTVFPQLKFDRNWTNMHVYILSKAPIVKFSRFNF